MKTKQDQFYALILAFDKALVNAPESGDHWLYLNAAPLPVNDLHLTDRLNCEQAFRPTYNALTLAGYDCQPSLEPELTSGATFDGAIIVAGRVRKVNEANIVRGWNATKNGARLIVVGDKTCGIQPLRKWVSTRTQIQDSFSKYHSLVFWIEKSGADWPLEEISLEMDGYKIASGMFSAGGPDKGSKLLVEHFDKRLRGKVADFGAGWGYLAAEALQRSERIQSIDLYEADWLSLEAAKQNLSGEDTRPVHFNWVDINAEFKKKPYDWVLMNPPFHAGLNMGRAAEPNIGRRFIEVAASTLISGGRLLMVANRTLPYEDILKHAFRRFQVLGEANGYKVFEAMR